MSPTVAPVAALILVCGPNARLVSRRPKVSHRILGKPLGRFAIDFARAMGAERLVVCVSETEELSAVVGALGDEEYVQALPAELIRSGLAQLGSLSGPVLVASAAWIPGRSDRQLLSEGQAAGSPFATFLRVDCALPTPPGSREPESLVAAVLIDAGNLSVACQTAANSDEVDLLATLRGSVPPGGAFLRRSPDGIVVEDRATMARAAVLVRDAKVRDLQAVGVTVEDPNSTWIGPEVFVGMDTVIRPNTYLEGKTSICEGCVIGPNVQMVDCVIDDEVVIHNAVLTSSSVGDGSKIGPFAQLRPGSRVKRKVKIGNFVELKNAEVDDRASLGHFAYIGDAAVGEHTNIGAGTITCNYDGKRKHRTVIGREAFVGTHSTLVAPLSIGDGAFIAAGSVITQDVPGDALAVGRARQSNKPEWARRRRELQEQE